jgi:hypothetical protein
MPIVGICWELSILNPIANLSNFCIYICFRYKGQLLVTKLCHLQIFPVVFFLNGLTAIWKSTLLKTTFPTLHILLKNPDNLQLLLFQWSIRFLNNYPKDLIIDEAQNALNFSYIQGIVDSNPTKFYILSGSRQNLVKCTYFANTAGRVGNTLLPFFPQQNRISRKKLNQNLKM